MSAASLPTLSSYAEWLQQTDDHAGHHLALVEQVQECLEQGWAKSPDSHTLAEKLERWRYQLLNEHASNLTPRDAELAETLLRTATELRGQGDRPVRRTVQAVTGQGETSDAWSVVLEVLDLEYPLEPLISRAQQKTAEVFATTTSAHGPRWPMLLYAPLYVSSHCVNHCTYCGFRYTIDMDRRQLTMDEVDQQIHHLEQHGFGHILVVGGEFPRLTTADYYSEVVQRLGSRGIEPAIEIAPQSLSAYAQMAQAGACGLTLYQETYDEQLYAAYHPRGPKANYYWRLESQDRAAEAGIGRVGFGVLLGLADPEQDMLAMIRHASYLSQRFPELKLSFGLPRIHEAPDDFTIPYRVSDEDLIRYYCTLRLAFPEATLVLSTRETPELRNKLAQICITQLSAGSSTSPGGYGDDEPDGGEQFPITDERSVRDVEAWLNEQGFPIVWKHDSPA
ncbi:radical SAM protein [Aeoliella mucimassa]|uniref:2-iminoacetate synthase n=1 Tax=Aeoliella mucimassa TaxID=2527972 RepID=A0A518ASM3_9BACT|nr:radical SAM protein [Aeoliella mucimassa]QDU57732.1 2-iminoacetate synthase [Aeoliella mucimassa]